MEENITKLINDLDLNNIPKHIAIIMDGNGRWAKERNLSINEGHRAGLKRVRPLLETCREISIEVISLYAFSTENWNRSQEEVSELMRLLKETIMEELPELIENKIRLQFSGNLERLPEGIKEKAIMAQEFTKNFGPRVLNLCISYGGREEIVQATRKISEKVKKGDLEPEKIDEKLFQQHLYTSFLPDPDLLIRTAGELRISNFLLWQIAYTEFIFLPTYWPDFEPIHLIQCIKEYQNRIRTFGGRTSS